MARFNSLAREDIFASSVFYQDICKKIDNYDSILENLEKYADARKSEGAQKVVCAFKDFFEQEDAILTRVALRGLTVNSSDSFDDVYKIAIKEQAYFHKGNLQVPRIDFFCRSKKMNRGMLRKAISLALEHKLIHPTQAGQALRNSCH